MWKRFLDFEFRPSTRQRNYSINRNLARLLVAAGTITAHARILSSLGIWQEETPSQALGFILSKAARAVDDEKWRPRGTSHRPPVAWCLCVLLREVASLYLVCPRGAGSGCRGKVCPVRRPGRQVTMPHLLPVGPGASPQVVLSSKTGIRAVLFVPRTEQNAPG